MDHSSPKSNLEALDAARAGLNGRHCRAGFGQKARPFGRSPAWNYVSRRRFAIVLLERCFAKR